MGPPVRRAERTPEFLEEGARYVLEGIYAQPLESIGADKEVVFSGNDHKIEIWAKERYESNEISNEDFVALAGMLSD